MRIGALGPEPSVTKVIQRTFKAILPEAGRCGGEDGRQAWAQGCRAAEKARISHYCILLVFNYRFPRVTKIREDKSWETSTNLQELEVGLHGSY